MKYKLIYLPAAISNIEEIKKYIRQDNDAAAIKLVGGNKKAYFDAC